MNLFKAYGFLKRNSPRFGGRDEAEIPNEEDSGLVDCFFLDALQFAGKNTRLRVSEIDGQRRGTDGAAVVELNLVGSMGGSKLTVSLQTGDCVDERRVCPGFNRSLGLGGGDDVLAASSTTLNPSSSNWRMMAVLPAPGAPVMMNLFIF